MLTTSGYINRQAVDNVDTLMKAFLDMSIPTTYVVMFLFTVHSTTTLLWITFTPRLSLRRTTRWLVVGALNLLPVAI